MYEGEDRNQMRFDVFLGSVVLHSILSTCDRLRTACGVVKDKRLRGIGFNGSVTGEPHCDEVGHLMVDGHCLRTRHGETNAISNTDRTNLLESEAIIVATPCIDCTKNLIHEGIKTIHYVGEYSNARGKEVIDEIATRQNVILHNFFIDWAEHFQKLFDFLARKGGVLYRAGYRLKVIKEPLEKNI